MNFTSLNHMDDLVLIWIEYKKLKKVNGCWIITLPWPANYLRLAYNSSWLELSQRKHKYSHIGLTEVFSCYVRWLKTHILLIWLVFSVILRMHVHVIIKLIQRRPAVWFKKSRHRSGGKPMSTCRLLASLSKLSGKAGCLKRELNLELTVTTLIRLSFSSDTVHCLHAHYLSPQELNMKSCDQTLNNIPWGHHGVFSDDGQHFSWTCVLLLGVSVDTHLDLGSVHISNYKWINIYIRWQ